MLQFILLLCYSSHDTLLELHMQCYISTRTNSLGATAGTLKRASSTGSSLSRAASAEPAELAGPGAGNKPSGSGGLWRFLGSGAASPTTPPPLGAADGAAAPVLGGSGRSLDGSTGAMRVLAEEATAAQSLRRAAQIAGRPAAQPAPPGGGGASPFSSPQRRAFPAARPVAMPPPPQAGSPKQGLRPLQLERRGSQVEHRLPASEFEDSQPGSTAHSERDANRSVAAATPGDAERLLAADGGDAGTFGQDQGPAAPQSAVAPPPGRRRAKLESLDKLIGQQPDVVRRPFPNYGLPRSFCNMPLWRAASSRRQSCARPLPYTAFPQAKGKALAELCAYATQDTCCDLHVSMPLHVLKVHHVRLHAAPSQRAYLPQWLAAPLGRRKPSATDAPAAPAQRATGLPPIAEHGGASDGGSRRISADFSHLKSAAAPLPVLTGECLPLNMHSQL